MSLSTATQLDNFTALAAALAPKLNVCAFLQQKRTATYTAYTYSIEYTGMGLSAPLKVQADTEAEALRRAGIALRDARRVVATDKLLAGLQADWESHELEDMRRKLLGACDSRAYETRVQQVQMADKQRYDTLMGHHHEEQGYYDQEQAA